MVMLVDGWMSGEEKPPDNTSTPSPAWTNNPTKEWTGEVNLKTHKY